MPVTLVDHLRNLLGADWMAENIALNFVAVDFAQIIHLFVGFNSFGNHLQIQIVCHGDDCAADRGVIGCLRQVLDERVVDLDTVDGQAFYIAEDE